MDPQREDDSNSAPAVVASTGGIHSSFAWRFAPLVIALAFGLLAVLVWRQSFVCDDAFIAFRYARHLAQGEGLRFNLGEHTPVEGYTQLGWVLWMSVVEVLDGDPVIWSRVIGISCAFALLVLVLRQARVSFGSGSAGTAATALFFATWPPILVWSTGGLGTMPFALCVFGTFTFLLGQAGRPRILLATLFALATIVMRADGLYWIAALYGLALFEFPRLAPDPRRVLLRALGAGSLTCVAFTAWQVWWRLQTYDDWLPNTARNKVALSLKSIERGFDYLATHLLEVPASFLLLALGAWLAWRSSKRVLGQAAAMVVATFAYGVLVGGDFMTTARFFVPAGAFLALLAGGLVAGAVQVLPRRTTPVAVGLMMLLMATSLPAAFNLHLAPLGIRKEWNVRWSQSYTSEYDMWVDMRDRAKGWAQLGRALGLHTRPGESLVRSTIGAVGYYSDLFIHDQFGLVNREVAASAPPTRRLGTPGHDYMAPKSFFRSQHPTYSYAHIHPASAKVMQGKQAQRIPLAVKDGFPPNRVLILVRTRAR